MQIRRLRFKSRRIAGIDKVSILSGPREDVRGFSSHRFPPDEDFAGRGGDRESGIASVLPIFESPDGPAEVDVLPSEFHHLGPTRAGQHDEPHDVRRVLIGFPSSAFKSAESCGPVRSSVFVFAGIGGTGTFFRVPSVSPREIPKLMIALSCVIVCRIVVVERRVPSGFRAACFFARGTRKRSTESGSISSGILFPKKSLM